MKPRVFVTRALPEAGMQTLYETCDVTVFPENRQPTREELESILPGYDGLLCTLMDTIDADLLTPLTRLQAISNYAVGYNNIDIEAATRLGLPVTNTPGVLTNATADMTWALLLAVTRRVVEGDRYVREGKWTGWSPLMLLGTELSGKTLGIIGCGRIGLAVAKRANAYDMNVIYFNRNRLDEATEREYRLSYADLDTLLRTSDIVSLHLPYTTESHHLIDAAALGKMKRSAYLLNTARGPIVDEAALAEALQSNRIAGAGLDVFEEEPVVHPGLLRLQNVVLAPHLGSATLETRTKMAQMAAENLVKVLHGEYPHSLVNPGVWDKRRRPQLR
jgi:glyoxylate reductase